MPPRSIATRTRKQDDADGEETKDQKLDILDDPVRMYLKQMGQVPLLTREQEVEISKRIEDAEIEVQKYLHRFGFTAECYLDLADKLSEARSASTASSSTRRSRAASAT